MKLVDYFTEPYKNENYFLKIRANFLFKMGIFLFLFAFITESVMAALGWIYLSKALAILPVLALGIGLSDFFLRKGKYPAAANTFILGITAMVLAGFLREPFNSPAYAFSSYIFYIFPCIVLSFIFCDIKITTAISIIFGLADLAVGLIMVQFLKYGDIYVSIVACSGTLLAIFMALLVCRVFTKIFNNTLQKSYAETERSNQQENFIRQVLKEGTDHVLVATKNVAEKNNQFSENSRNQAANVEEISASVEEISAGVEGVADYASTQESKLEELAKELDNLSEVISLMDQEITETVNTTAKISEAAQKSADSVQTMEDGIGNISDSSNEIINIIAIINDIADQINLLSLNASIEAARAGNAGRGFAVVADEISKLADKTATSIKDITALINKNNDEIAKGKESVSESVVAIKGIMAEVSEISHKISNLNQSKENQVTINQNVQVKSENVQQLSQEIAAATFEQKNALAEIVDSITAISEISEKNSAAAEEMASDTEHLVGTVDHLNEKIANYQK